MSTLLTQKQNQIGKNAIKIMLMELYQDKPELLITKTKCVLMQLGMDNVTAQKIARNATRTYFKTRRVSYVLNQIRRRKGTFKKHLHS